MPQIIQETLDKINTVLAALIADGKPRIFGVPNERAVCVIELQATLAKSATFAATGEQLEAARALHEGDEINIDDDAMTSPAPGEGYWVQAWVWVPEDADAC
jgi:hypothetical protein